MSQQINKTSTQQKVPINYDRGGLTSASIPIEASPLYSPLLMSFTSSPKILSFDSPKSEPIKKERWKRSSLQELEANLEEINGHQRLSQISEEARPIVMEAIGRVSHAVELEKSGNTPLGSLEEVFSKASASLFDATRIEVVQKDEESKYWLKLLEVHVNSHLRKIVQLADSGSKKTPNFVQQLEMENRRLRDDIKSLKSYVDDMKVELNHFKRDGLDPGIFKDEEVKPSSSPKIVDVGDHLRKMKQQLDEYLTEEEGEILVNNLQKVVIQGEEVLKKLNHARSLVSSIKHLDQDLVHLLRHPEKVDNTPNSEESIPQNQINEPNHHPFSESKFSTPPQKPLPFDNNNNPQKVRTS